MRLRREVPVLFTQVCENFLLKVNRDLPLFSPGLHFPTSTGPILLYFFSLCSSSSNWVGLGWNCPSWVRVYSIDGTPSSFLFAQCPPLKYEVSIKCIPTALLQYALKRSVSNNPGMVSLDTVSFPVLSVCCLCVLPHYQWGPPRSSEKGLLQPLCNHDWNWKQISPIHSLKYECHETSPIRLLNSPCSNSVCASPIPSHPLFADTMIRNCPKSCKECTSIQGRFS